MLPTALVYAIALARALLCLYLGWLVGATLFPLPLHALTGGPGLAGHGDHPNVVPLASIRATLAMPGVWPRVRLLAGNVLVFTPVGVLAPGIWRRLDSLARVALAGLVLSRHRARAARRIAGCGRLVPHGRRGRRAAQRDRRAAGLRLGARPAAPSRGARHDVLRRLCRPVIAVSSSAAG
jgi:hypothetical protein